MIHEYFRKKKRCNNEINLFALNIGDLKVIVYLCSRNV